MSTRTKRRTSRRVAAALATAGALVMSSGAALLITAPSADAAAVDKYFVCKYVGTPGVDETLQTGDNPISVAASAIKQNPIVVGSYFADDQGRSYVLALDDTAPGPEGDPPVSECPPPTPPEPEEIAVDVVFVDPDCDNDNTASYSLTGDTADVTVEATSASGPDIEVTVTATANEGFEFAGGETTYSESHTFGPAEDCAAVEPPTVEPPVVEPPVTTPTVVHAGLADVASSDRTEQGLALLASGLLLMVAAGGLARPRRARR